MKKHKHPSIFRIAVLLTVLSLFAQDSSFAEDTTAKTPALDSSQQVQLKKLEEAALQAEKNGAQNARQCWYSLATAEVQAHMPDKALQHTLRGFQQYKAADFDVHRSLLPFGVVSLLEKEGREKDAEHLLREAALKIKEVHGASSGEYVCQLSHSIFYYSEHNEQKALSILDEILTTCDLRSTLPSSGHGGTEAYNSLNPLLDWANRIKQKDLAMKILQKILIAQRKQLGEDDERVGYTLATIGSIEHANGKDAEAEISDKKALQILTPFLGEEQALMRLSGYLDVLRNLGKVDEAKKIESMLNKPSRPVQRTNANRRMTKAERFADLEKQYEEICKVSAYSEGAQKLLDQLMTLAAEQKDWQQLVKYANKRLEIAKRSSNTSFDKLLKIRRYVVEGEVNSGNLARARSVLAELPNPLPTNLTAAQLVLIAEMQIACEQTKDTAAVLARAEKLNESMDVKDPRSNDPKSNLSRVGELYAKIGQEERGKELRTRGRVRFLEMVQAHSSQRPRDTYVRSATDDLEAPDQTRKGDNPVAPKVVSDDYCFDWTAVASRSLIMNGNAQAAPYTMMPVPTPFQQNSLVGSYGYLKARQTGHQCGGFSWTYGGNVPITPTPSAVPRPPYFGSTGPGGPGGPQPGGSGPGGPPYMMSPFGSGSGIGRIPAMPFRGALKAPATARNLGVVEKNFYLEPGDYTADRIATDSLTMPTTGRVRIFLNQNSTGQVFWAKPGAFINFNPAMGPDIQSRRLELWYNGTGTIKLDRDCIFSGVIYAPFARVEIGPGKAMYVGSIVAKDIYANGNATLSHNWILNKWRVDK